MIVGSCSDHGPYVWGGFDAMRVMTYKHNENPETGLQTNECLGLWFCAGKWSRCFGTRIIGKCFRTRGKIYAEILGGEVNSGGQRHGGTLTAPNPEAVQRCINNAL